MRFHLVDKITAWTPFASIRGVKTVSFEEYCLKEAFGDEAHLPETLLLESFLQLGNWLILLSTDFQWMGMAVRISQIQFHHCLGPGMRLEMKVQMVCHRQDGFELEGEGWANGQRIISGMGCLAIPIKAGDYVHPEHMRILFSEIHQPEGRSK